MENTDIDTSDISRREFLKGAAIAAASSVIAKMDLKGKIFGDSTDLKDISFLENNPDELTSYAAILSSVEEIAGHPYTWEVPGYDCGAFVGRYMRHLGFEVGKVSSPLSTYSPKATDPMPEDTTVKQAPYIRELNRYLGGDLIAEIPVKQMLTDTTFWEQIPAGTVMYLPEPIGHHGYDTYTHTTVFMGLDSTRSPMFAEFSGYMKHGPEYGHGFEKFSSMYRGKSIEPMNPSKGELKVLMFDAVEASRRFGLEKGVVTPDYKLFNKLGYDNVVSININDGRVSMWDITKDGAMKRKIGDREEMFSVLGRRLKRNELLSKEYWDKMRQYHPNTIYDSSGGCHIDENGVRRNTYTPQLISELEKTEVLANFGGLGSSTHTDICLLKQLYYDEHGSKVVSKRYSAYTLHEVPRGTADQEILLREPSLIKANSEGIPVDPPNISSGCVNLDGESWRILKEELISLQKDGRKISVMFSTPKTNQNLLLKYGTEESRFYEEDPFGGQIRRWDYVLPDGIGHDKWIYYKRPKEYPLFRPTITESVVNRQGPADIRDRDRIR